MPESADPDQPAQQPDRGPEQERSSQHRPWHYRSARQAEPSRPFGPSGPLRRLWFNAAMRIGASRVVHGIRFDPINESGDERVAPACHTGHDRADHSEDLHRIRDEEVSCRNCLTYPVAWVDGQPYDPGRNQLPLPLLGVPGLHSWPPTGADATRDTELPLE